MSWFERRRFGEFEINSGHGKSLQTDPIGHLMGRQALELRLHCTVRILGPGAPNRGLCAALAFTATGRRGQFANTALVRLFDSSEAPCSNRNPSLPGSSSAPSPAG
jgi:hypothetical protein